eukprot:1195664-Prorocentrum_minimum.AAC.5
MYLYLGEWNPRLWGIAEVHDPVYLTAPLLKLTGALITSRTFDYYHNGSIISNIYIMCSPRPSAPAPAVRQLTLVRPCRMSAERHICVTPAYGWGLGSSIFGPSSRMSSKSPHS